MVHLRTIDDLLAELNVPTIDALTEMLEQLHIRRTSQILNARNGALPEPTMPRESTSRGQPATARAIAARRPADVENHGEQMVRSAKGQTGASSSSAPVERHQFGDRSLTALRRELDTFDRPTRLSRRRMTRSLSDVEVEDEMSELNEK